MMMRTKDVIMSSSDGSKLSVVINASNCKDRLYCISLPELLTFTSGIPWAQATAGSNTAATAKAAQRQRSQVFTESAPVASQPAVAQRRHR